jgi:hypothetical protein
LEGRKSEPRCTNEESTTSSSPSTFSYSGEANTEREEIQTTKLSRWETSQLLEFSLQSNKLQKEEIKVHHAINER